MTRKLLQCPTNSVFSNISEDQLKHAADINKRVISISGSVNSPGVISVPENATLNDVLTLAGGITHESTFKAAQLGIPFGYLLTIDDLNRPSDFKMFTKGMVPALIILSAEDCIVQYSKYYLEYLLCRMNSDSYVPYNNVKNEIYEMYKIFIKISKGVSSMQDIFHLRNYANIVTEKSEIHLSIIESIIQNFYSELIEHIQHKHCETFQCNHLAKLTITSKCIGCGLCETVCPVDCIHGEKKEQHHIDYVRCTHCGACVSICPVNAITSGNNSTLFLRDLATPGKTVITQMAPSVRVALGESFGYEPGDNIENKIAAGLKQLGKR